MSKMKSMLGIALMMSALTEQEHRNNHPMFFDDRETDKEKKIRLVKDEREKYKSKGLTEFFYGENSLWALNKKSADRKARNKHWL